MKGYIGSFMNEHDINKATVESAIDIISNTDMRIISKEVKKSDFSRAFAKKRHTRRSAWQEARQRTRNRIPLDVRTLSTCKAAYADCKGVGHYRV